MLVVIRFRIGGNVRFLSHAETMRLFQRSLVRAGVQIAYSQGFNPHQKMSLVLPRSVGVESDDEILCLRLKDGQTDIDAEAMKATLPEGIEIISVTINQTTAPEPIMASYAIKTKKQYADEKAGQNISQMPADEKIVINRRTGEDSSKLVDVRPFLETIKTEPWGFTVDCKISPAGTIRVDEILSLLQLKTEDLAGPVRRTSVQWKGI
jgi:radical SAM-linked protein